MIDSIPLNMGPLPQLIAWWIGYIGMLVGFYVIFICERHDIPLLLYGAVSSLMGVCVYSTIRSPPWLPNSISRPILITSSLVLVLVLMGYLTYLVWRHYRLKPPWVRIGEILEASGEWLQE